MARSFSNPRTRVALVRNHSERQPGSFVAWLAVHTTEGHNRVGISDLEALRAEFDNPASQASSHYGIDGEGRSWQFVSEARKAWTILEANSYSVNYELIGFAADSPQTWRSRWRQLSKLAQHLAYDSRKYRIPLRRGKVGNRGGAIAVVRKGVIGHIDVTRAGFGTHTDPGPNFPWRRVLALARVYKVRGWRRGLPR